MSKSNLPPMGVYVPAVVWFDANDELDDTAIKAHVLRLAQGGVTGILVQGSNGEAQHLTHDERKQAIRLTKQTLADNGFGNVTVVAGTGGQSTKETIKLCVDAHDAGAQFALVLTPGVWPPQMTKTNIIRFFQAVADASPIPIMIYNFPTVTAGIDLDSDTIITLAAHPNIVGVKLSCGNVGKLHRIASTYNRDFRVFAGKADVFLQGVLSGSAGAMAALPNVAPKAHIHTYNLFLQGELEEAFKMQALLGHADWQLGKLGSITAIKSFVARHFDYGTTNVRGPLAPLDIETATADKLEELIQLEKSLPDTTRLEVSLLG
ncbi:hypothetical protein EIP86_005648 [Pleurotus ostreatoroseus]|nr:hypothetical protein EIP86_005648 [Pleurotus ostreatoroseus]